MISLRDCEQLFIQFLDALYAADVTLLQRFRHSGSIQDRKFILVASTSCMTES